MKAIEPAESSTDKLIFTFPEKATGWQFLLKTHAHVELLKKKAIELYGSQFIPRFAFILRWFISTDLRSDSNNSVTCIKSYAVFQ